MADASPKQWEYFSDKKGVIDALGQYYSHLCATDERLKQALAQFQNAEAALDARMRELAELEEDQEDE